MFQIFNSSSSKKKSVVLESIFICDSAGAPIRAVETIIAISNEGLEGDRYQSKKGYWDPVEGCQVTIITTHELDRARKKAPCSLEQGQHRRNLVLSGINPKKLIGKTIQIGDALMQYEKPRPPCGYLDQVVMKGTARALSKNSGFCFRVVRSGSLSVGDNVLIV